MPNPSGYEHEKEEFERLAETAARYEKVCSAALLAEDTPDPAEWMRIEQQGNWPSCGGHSLSSLAEFLYWKKTGQVVQLSRMFAWVESQRKTHKPTKGNGVTIWGSVEAIKDVGIPLESLAKYNTNNWYSTFSSEVYADAKTRTAAKHYEMKSVDDIRDFVKSGMGGVACGVEFNFQRGAWHAIPILHVTPSGKFKGPNSWPVSADRDGDKDGWFEWSESELDRHLDNRGSVFYGISDLSTPQVRQGENWLDAGILG